MSFDNEREVMLYICEKPKLFNLYKALPSLIERTFGSVQNIHLSIFRDYEEDGSNLKVEIQTNYSLDDELFDLEDKLFALISENLHLEALKYLTITFV